MMGASVFTPTWQDARLHERLHCGEKRLSDHLTEGQDFLAGAGSISPKENAYVLQSISVATIAC